MNDDSGGTHQYKILVINPGSTSTKIAVFEGNGYICSQTLQHSSSELAQHNRIVDQLSIRKDAIDSFLSANAVDFSAFSAVAGRGGLLRPVSGGAYRINDRMCEDLRAARYGEHASNLGALLAKQYSDSLEVPAFIVDPVAVDEFEQPSRITGVPGLTRKSRLHALNIRAVARVCAADLGKDVGAARFVIAHMGGGISVCAMNEGRIVDSIDPAGR